MFRMKAAWITVLTVVCFAGGMAIGTTSDWWRTEGRKTPLDGADLYVAHGKEESVTEGQSLEDLPEAGGEAHSEAMISGETTVQQALDLGIPIDMLTSLLAGPVEDTDRSIKVIAQERGLQFGVIKDELNIFLSQ